MYNTRSALFGLSVCVLAIAWAGCAGDRAANKNTRSTIDDIGREVRVPLQPERVVSLAPSITEVVFAAGAGDRLAAVTSADNYPPAVEDIQKVTAFPLDHEGLVALAPDLILATDQINSVRDLDALSQVGIPSYFLRFNRAADVFLAIRHVGRLLGTETVADRSADSLEAVWRDLVLSNSEATRPSVLLLAGYDVLYAFGRDSYTNEIIRAAGGRSITARLDGQAATLSDEFVLTEQPEMIVGTFGDDFDVGLILERHPTWTNLPAVEDGRIYSINPDLISRPGPRIIEGARVIARWIGALRESAAAP